MQVKQTVVRGLMAGALLLGSVGLAAATNTDDALEARIEKGLDKVDALKGLGVDVDEGVTTLKGEVASTVEKTRAEKIAKTAGARRIVNQIEIDADKAVARIKDRAEAKKDQIDENAARAKENVDRQAEATQKRVEQKIDGTKSPSTTTPTTTATGEKSKKEVFDPLVTAKVKTRIIKDDMLEKSEINVDSDNDGLVTLKGTVPSEAARARALELARTTEGVRKVVDNLAVKAPVVK